MDNEPEEVIKHQMLETRASLAEKLETLEQQVVGTVQSATSAVTDTVESVKDAVQQTVELAKSSVQDTVEAVKDTFDISRQVREHPWLMVGGSVTVGFAAGCLLDRAGVHSRDRYSMAAASSSRAFVPKARSEHNGEGTSQRMAEEPRSASERSHGLLDDLGQRFETEIHKLKGLALGAVFGVVRDLIANSAPPQVSSQLKEIVDSATVKLGGQPIHGPVLNMFEHSFAGREGSQQSSSSVERNPRGTTHTAASCAAGPID